MNGIDNKKISKTGLQEALKNLAESIIRDEGMDLVDMEYFEKGARSVLRFFIAKDGGVTLDNCADISKQISIALDVEDIIEHKYILEVSSPGINRSLKKDSDFIRAIGNKVKIQVNEPINGQKNFRGELLKYDGNKAIITHDNKTIEITRENINKARLNIEIKI